MVKMSVETPVYHNNHDAFKQTKKQLMNTKLSEKKLPFNSHTGSFLPFYLEIISRSVIL